jgi:hypothetical protein
MPCKWFLQLDTWHKIKLSENTKLKFRILIAKCAKPLVWKTLDKVMKTICQFHIAVLTGKQMVSQSYKKFSAPYRIKCLLHLSQKITTVLCPGPDESSLCHHTLYYCKIWLILSYNICPSYLANFLTMGFSSKMFYTFFVISIFIKHFFLLQTWHDLEHKIFNPTCKCSIMQEHLIQC